MGLGISGLVFFGDHTHATYTKQVICGLPNGLGFRVLVWRGSIDHSSYARPSNSNKGPSSMAPCLQKSDV